MVVVIGEKLHLPDSQLPGVRGQSQEARREGGRKSSPHHGEEPVCKGGFDPSGRKPVCMLFEDHKTLIMRSKCPDCEMQLKGCLVPLCWWCDGCLECLRSGSACEVEGVPEASTKSFWLNSAGS